jgi:anti-anti-sigma factor
MAIKHEVEFINDNDAVIVKLKGKCEAGLANLILEKLEDFRMEGIRNDADLIVDFSGITQASSTAVTVLVMLKHLSKKMKGKIAFANISEYLLKILKAIELEYLFDVYPTIEDAKKALEKN